MWRTAGCLAVFAGCVLEPAPDFYLDGPVPGTSGGANGDSSSSSTSGSSTLSSSASGESTSDGTTTGSESSSDDTLGPPTSACAEASLGSTVGSSVATGSTGGAADVWSPSCAEAGSGDVIYEWTAPVSGTFVFDTSGSYYDTVIFVLQTCDGAELACSDDAGDHLWSRASMALEAGETVLVGISGWTEGDGGTYQLNITGP